MEFIAPGGTPREAVPQPQLTEGPGFSLDGPAGAGSPTSIAESLTVLAEFAGVGLGGLDVDQLDIIALRLVAECGDEQSLTSFGPIVDEVRRAEGAADASTLGHPSRRGVASTDIPRSSRPLRHWFAKLAVVQGGRQDGWIPQVSRTWRSR